MPSRRQVEGRSRIHHKKEVKSGDTEWGEQGYTTWQQSKWIKGNDIKHELINGKNSLQAKSSPLCISLLCCWTVQRCHCFLLMPVHFLFKVVSSFFSWRDEQFQAEIRWQHSFSNSSSGSALSFLHTTTTTSKGVVGKQSYRYERSRNSFQCPSSANPFLLHWFKLIFLVRIQWNDQRKKEKVASN